MKVLRKIIEFKNREEFYTNTVKIELNGYDLMSVTCCGEEEVKAEYKANAYLKEEAEENEPKWIPVKWRELTEEEKEYYGEEFTKMADFPLPDDGDEILISKMNGYWVDLVVFANDDGYISDESGNDWVNDVDAWMPLPSGYVKEAEK